MSLEKDFILSFYKEIAVINEKHQVFLVQHIETGEIFIKKTVSLQNLGVYEILKNTGFSDIPRIIALAKDENSLIIIEEYIHGKTLEQLLSERDFTEIEIVSILMELCGILLPLHRHDPKIIHRDIKPSNLILDGKNHLYLIDFDASRQYRPENRRDTVLMGTAEYAAPEQYGFLQSDERTDIFSMGILLHKMLTGSFPSQKNYDGPLSPIIKKCTSIDPDSRYASCAELSQALETALCKINASEKKDSISFSVNKFSVNKFSEGAKKVSHLKNAFVGITSLILFALCMFTDFTSSQGTPLTGFSLWINRFGCAASFLSFLFYCTNTAGFRARFPYKVRAKILQEILRLIFGGLLCLFVPIIIILILE